MERKILAVCPSKGRPEMFKRMVESFCKTKTLNTHLLVSLNDEDERGEEYEEICKDYELTCFSSMEDSITNHFNNAFQVFKDYDFYHLTNDDTIYHTVGWDRMLTDVISQKPGISYGDDGFQGENLPTFPMISGDIIRAVGWLQMPILNKFCGDVVWKQIGQEANCLFYVPSVTIEHHHFINNKRMNDDPKYKETYDADREAFATWLVGFSTKDIRNVRRVVHGHPNHTESE